MFSELIANGAQPTVSRRQAEPGWHDYMYFATKQRDCQSESQLYHTHPAQPPAQAKHALLKPAAQGTYSRLSRMLF